MLNPSGYAGDHVMSCDETAAGNGRKRRRGSIVFPCQATLTSSLGVHHPDTALGSCRLLQVSVAATLVPMVRPVPVKIFRKR